MVVCIKGVTKSAKCTQKWPDNFRVLSANRRRPDCCVRVSGNPPRKHAAIHTDTHTDKDTLIKTETCIDICIIEVLINYFLSTLLGSDQQSEFNRRQK